MRVLQLDDSFLISVQSPSGEGGGGVCDTPRSEVRSSSENSSLHWRVAQEHLTAVLIYVYKV